jgi:hypothetical protein
MDPAVSPKKKTKEGKGVEAHFLTRSTSGVEGHVGAPLGHARAQMGHASPF